MYKQTPQQLASVDCPPRVRLYNHSQDGYEFQVYILGEKEFSNLKAFFEGYLLVIFAHIKTI